MGDSEPVKKGHDTTTSQGASMRRQVRQGEVLVYFVSSTCRPDRVTACPVEKGPEILLGQPSFHTGKGPQSRNGFFRFDFKPSVHPNLMLRVQWGPLGPWL